MTSEKLEQIRSRLSTLDAIPTIPVVIQPLLAMLQTPIDDVDLKKVKELISYDNTIAALCLRVANSPLFGRRKVENLLATGAETIAAGNPGCAIQIAAVSEQMGRPLRVLHPIELIQMSIQGGTSNGKR